MAVPEDVLTKYYGGNAKSIAKSAPWRTARAELTYGNQTIQVAIVDVDPGRKPRARGVVTDLTDHLANGMGMGDESPAQIRLLPPNICPDYMKNPDAWYAEQANIAKRFQNNPAAQISPEPAPTPWTGPAGPAGAHGAPPASQTPDQTDTKPATTKVLSTWAAIGQR